MHGDGPLTFVEFLTAGPFVHGFLFVALALFPIVNPMGMAPIFLTYTQELDAKTTSLLARRVALNSFALTAASLVVGSLVLKFFGLSIPAVRIAGGILLASAGWQLLNQGQGDSSHRAPEASSQAIAGAFYPLTLPLTVGPGSIAVLLTLGSTSANVFAGGDDLIEGIGTIAGLALLSLVIYLCYDFAEPILARLGASGVNVVLRLSAFILMCIGVQIAIEGYKAIFVAAPAG